MTRREFSNHVRLAAWKRCGGNCEVCSAIITGVAEYDHIVADALNGEPTLENCRCVCRGCHGEKSAIDIKAIRHADRCAKAAAGIKRKSKPMPGTKRSGWKHAMSGEWSRR